MQGIHGLGATLAAERIADDDARRAAGGASPGRDRERQLPRSKTAFTDAALWRALLVSVAQARPVANVEAPGTTALASTALASSPRAVRWCGATPLAQKRAAWQQRRQARRLAT